MKRNGILIVEDDPESCRMLTFMIARRYPDTLVYSACNGRKGLEAFIQFIPDVVITDINMPVMNGLQMAHRIGSLRPETRFIALTANLERAMPSSEVGSFSFDHCFTKPVNLSEIFMALGNILDN